MVGKNENKQEIVKLIRKVIMLVIDE